MTILRGLVAIMLLGGMGSAVAQLQVGAMTHLNLEGTVGASYSGGYSDTAFSSNHGVGLNGDGFLTGDYFNPKFLNFNIHPYYGRTQETADSVSIGANSGLGATVNLFAGSPFPGSINYNINRNSTGQYALAGSGSLVTLGNSNGFGLGWGENLFGLPHVYVGFFHDDANSNIVGTQGTNLMRSTSFNVSSDYRLFGWPLNATYLHTNSGSDVPAVLTGFASSEKGTSSAFQLMTSHPLPFMHGGFSGNYSRTVSNSSYNSNGETTGDSTKSNDASAGLSFYLTRTVSANTQVNYNEDLLSSLVQQLVNNGVAVAGLGPLRNLQFNGSISWAAPRGILVSGGGYRQQQYFQGVEYDTSAAYGVLNYNYNKPLFGSLYFTFGFNDNANKDGNTGMGFFSNINFTRKMHGFDVSASYGYSQNVETIASFVTSSGMSYGVGVSRKLFDRVHWNANFGGGHSGFSSITATDHSERFSTGVSRRGIAANVFYAQSHAYSLVTSAGLVTTAVPINLLGANSTMFDSTNYGASGTLALFRHVNLAASYSKGHGLSTLPDSSQLSNNSTTQNLLLRIPYRKIYFTAGYNRILQGTSTAGNPLHPLTSYNFGIYRWMKFF